MITATMATTATRTMARTMLNVDWCNAADSEACPVALGDLPVEAAVLEVPVGALVEDTVVPGSVYARMYCPRVSGWQESTWGYEQRTDMSNHASSYCGLPSLMTLSMYYSSVSFISKR
jgi:hypothetical protein